MNLACLLGHDFGDWELRPPLIGARVEWLYWQKRCRRTSAERGILRQCPATRQRWFRVRIPGWAKLPSGIGHAIPVTAYLDRIRAKAPDPETLRDGRMPTKQQLGV